MYGIYNINLLITMIIFIAIKKHRDILIYILIAEDCTIDMTYIYLENDCTLLMLYFKLPKPMKKSMKVVN